MTFWLVVVNRCVRRRNRALRQICAVPVTSPLASPYPFFHLNISVGPAPPSGLTDAGANSAGTAHLPRLRALLEISARRGSRFAWSPQHLLARDTPAASARPHSCTQVAPQSEMHFAQGETPAWGTRAESGCWRPQWCTDVIAKAL